MLHFHKPQGLFAGHMNYSSYENAAKVIMLKRGLSESCYAFFSTLANPTRLAILELLRNGSKNVTEIADILNQEQSMISHNLRPLVRCGFVLVKRKWKERIYSLNEKTMKPLFQIIEKHTDAYCPKMKCSKIDVCEGD